MTTHLPIITLISVVLALSLSACSRTTKDGDGGAVSTQKLQKETEEAFQTTKQYTLEKKEEYRRKIQAELEDLDRKIKALREKSRHSGQKAKAESDQGWERLKPKRDAVRRSLDRLESATERTWVKLKRGSDDALNDLKQAYDKLAARF